MTDATRIRRGATYRCLCAALLLAHSALGQAGQTSRADELFRSAREAMKAGKFDEARDKFRESNQLEPAVGTALNLAVCEERLGRLVRARDLYEQAVRELAVGDDRLPIARQGAARVDARLARLTVRLATGSPADTRVLRDGAPLPSASLGTPLAADPGPLTLIVTALGHQDRVLKIVLGEGEQRELVVSPGTATKPGASAGDEPRASDVPAEQARARPEPRAEPATGSSASYTVGWVLTGLGAASLAVGSIAGVMVIDKKNTVSEHCDAQGYCEEEGLEAARAGRTLDTVSTVTFIAGLAAVGAGLYLVLSSDDGSGRETAVGATPLAGGGGLSLAARF